MLKCTYVVRREGVQGALTSCRVFGAMLADAVSRQELAAGGLSGLVHPGCGGPDESVDDSRTARAYGMPCIFYAVKWMLWSPGNPDVADR